MRKEAPRHAHCAARVDRCQSDRDRRPAHGHADPQALDQSTAGAFRGAIRIIDGEVPGLGAKWTRGYGRWVRDILVWTKAPFLFRNELLVADSLIADARPATPGEVKRLGKHPTVLTVAVEGGARIELASADGPDRALGPFAATSGPNAGQPINSPGATS